MSNWYDGVSLPDDVAQAANQDIGGDAGSQSYLPTSPLILGWRNSDERAAPTEREDENGNIIKLPAGALWYGGWNATPEAVEDVLGTSFAGREFTDLPPIFRNLSTTPRNGGDKFPVNVARVIGFSPVASRWGWWKSRNFKTGKLSEKPSKVLEVYGILASFSKDEQSNVTFEPWCTTLLRARVFQVQNLAGALAKFGKATERNRGAVGQNLFYHLIGSVGREPKQQKSGSSFITAIELHLPEVITDDFLRRSYIGEKMAEIWFDLFRASVGWAESWDSHHDYDAALNAVSTGGADEAPREEPPPFYGSAPIEDEEPPF